MLRPDATIGATTLDYCAPLLEPWSGLAVVFSVFRDNAIGFSRLVKGDADALMALRAVPRPATYPCCASYARATTARAPPCHISRICD